MSRTHLTQQQIDSLAASFLPVIKKFFQSEEGLYGTAYSVTEENSGKYIFDHVTVNGRSADKASGEIVNSATHVVFYNTAPPVKLPVTELYYTFGGMMIVGAGLWLIHEKWKSKRTDM